MKHCDKCKVDVRGGDILCPLCQNQLTGVEEESVFPDVPTIYKQFKLFFKLLIFFTVSGGIICIGINLMIPQPGFWSVLVLIGILFFWISLVSVLKRRGNLFKNVTFQVFAFSLLSLVMDYFIGWTGWSLNLFIPIVCSVAMLSLAVISKVRKMPPEDYVVYLIADILFAGVPTVLFFVGLITMVIPSVLCMVFSAITFVALVVFEGKNLWLEVVKRFHI